LADGSPLDLVQATNLANCEKPVACSGTDLAAVTADRPWGANNPFWQPYAYGPLTRLLAGPASHDSPYYVLLLVADDPGGTHHASSDEREAAVRESIALRAEAFGPGGAHAVLEVIASRPRDTADNRRVYNLDVGPFPTSILSWREVR
jgi:hypothetical protein